MLEHEKVGMTSKKRKTRMSKSLHNKSRGRRKEGEEDEDCKFNLLTSDTLEHIACYLDTLSALALFRTSKTVSLLKLLIKLFGLISVNKIL